MAFRFLKNGALVLLAVAGMACAPQTKTPTELPRELLGLHVGMAKAEAEKLLDTIGTAGQEEREIGRLWKLKNDPYFQSVAVGFNEENRVRFITAFAHEANAGKRIRFTEVGDISTAKQEITEQHHRYIWKVPASDTLPQYQVILYGDQKDFVSYYTLVEYVDAPTPGAG